MKKALSILLLLPLLVFWQPSAHASDAEFARGALAYGAEDYKKAHEIFLAEAEQGRAEAQLLLAIMYFNGVGISQDYKEAFKWFRLSAEQGVGVAQYMLAEAYRFGKGTSQNYKKAFKWHQSAARQGVTLAQGPISAMYYEGQGVSKNDIYAYMWMSLANINGNEISQEILDRMKKQLTPSQIEKAQTLADRCLESDYQDCN